MSKIVHVILFGSLVLVCSCMCVNEKRKGYQIEEDKRVSRMIGMDGFPTEKVQYEYYIVSKDKRSAVVIGYVVEQMENVALYITGNTSTKCEQTLPVDDKMEIDMLDYVICKIKNNRKHSNIKSVQLSMKTCGVANLNISKNYWQTKRWKEKFFQQPLFYQICTILKRYGYEVYDVSKSDFYPLTAREIGKYHILPDTCSLNSTAIDGIIILKCKKVEY